MMLDSELLRLTSARLSAPSDRINDATISGFGTKRTSHPWPSRSGVGAKADMRITSVSRVVQLDLCLRIGKTLAEVFGSQYADQASINLRRFSNASLRR